MSGGDKTDVEILCAMVCHEPPGKPFRRWFLGSTADGWEYLLAEPREPFAPWTLKRRRLDPAQSLAHVSTQTKLR
jgi:hypothetical protein